MTPEELNKFELEIELSLPEDYKAHMLKYNGGTPLSYYFYFGEPEDGIRLSYFFSIEYGALLVEKQDYLPKMHISIGKTETGYLSMSLDEENFGAIYVYYSEVELELIATSFTEFLNGLIDYSDDFENQ
ncbi:SMI1/KNR4 family protein [Flavobacterium kingsejongi]|uniref:SMI1/KNR4 family protein n=1 Tax=Flavobacterium kingsejongi TaxID=1678728 RepID=UPI001D13207F|nr:SMI1/KNR4 family protein [Flavobacterium kingsejongi]